MSAPRIVSAQLALSEHAEAVEAANRAGVRLGTWAARVLVWAARSGFIPDPIRDETVEAIKHAPRGPRPALDAVGPAAAVEVTGLEVPQGYRGEDLPGQLGEEGAVIDAEYEPADGVAIDPGVFEEERGAVLKDLRERIHEADVDPGPARISPRHPALMAAARGADLLPKAPSPPPVQAEASTSGVSMDAPVPPPFEPGENPMAHPDVAMFLANKSARELRADARTWLIQRGEAVNPVNVSRWARQAGVPELVLRVVIHGRQD